MFKKIHSLKIVVVFLGLGLSVFGCEKITSPIRIETEPFAAAPLTVMTCNVYLGSSTESVLGVENLLQVPTEVTNVYTVSYTHLTLPTTPYV